MQFISKDGTSKTSCNPLEGMFANIRVMSGEEADNRVKEHEKQQKEKAFSEWQEACGLDTDFYTASIGGKMSEETAKACHSFVSKYKNEEAPILLILGEVGTGKTYSVAAVMNALQTGVFVDMSELNLTLDTAKHFNASKTKEQIMHEMTKYKLLCLDEVGRFGSRDEQEILFYLVNKRYANHKPIIIASNMNGAEFAKYIGKAVTDRIRSRVITIKLEGRSLRTSE